jgi:hypothetical protein
MEDGLHSKLVPKGIIGGTLVKLHTAQQSGSQKRITKVDKKVDHKSRSQKWITEVDDKSGLQK